MVTLRAARVQADKLSQLLPVWLFVGVSFLSSFVGLLYDCDKHICWEVEPGLLCGLVAAGVSATWVSRRKRSRHKTGPPGDVTLDSQCRSTSQTLEPVAQGSQAPIVDMSGSE